MSEQQEQEYLTFKLGDEEFGVDILCVQEIRVMSQVTELPNAPEYLRGVINLRGVIIPIVDLRQRFGMTPLAYDNQTVMIILHNHNKEYPMVVGIVVDAVSEVYKFDHHAIRGTPPLGSQIESSFLKGLASVNNKLIILLNTATLLDQDQLYRLTKGEVSLVD